MRTPGIVAASMMSVAVLTLCACAGVVGLAHGDPGRGQGGAGSTQTTVAAVAPAPAPDAPITGLAAGSIAPSAVAVGPISAIIVTFNNHMQQLAASDPRLTPDAIAAALETELRAHQLFASGAASVHGTLAITVEDFNSTLASNVTVLGYTFRNVVLTGSVLLRAAPAGGRSAFTVHARAHVSNRDPGEGSLAGLYGRFAVLTVAALRGVEAPSESTPR
jgi:hypothetical protein